MFGRNLTFSFALVALAAAACSSDPEPTPTPILNPTTSSDAGGAGGSGGATTTTNQGGSGAGGMTTTPCDEADMYDTDCASVNEGQWCWDGGDGGELFCGCDPMYGNDDCQIDGYERCNPDTLQCEPAPDCGDDSNEDNGSEAMATALTGTTPVQGAVCAFDEDWFTFTATGGAASVSATWTDDGGTDLDLFVTDCAGTTIGTGDSTDAASEEVVVTGLTASTAYCVRVVHYAGAANGDDVSYGVSVEPRTECFLDSDCGNNEVCPFIGVEAGVCADSAPAAGCGDDVAGDNDTSGSAEALTSGVAVTEGSCDGNPNNPPDIDWFSFTVTGGESVAINVDQSGGFADGDVDVRLFDASGELWGGAVDEDNPVAFGGAGLPAGTYYIVVDYYDLDSMNAASTTYDISVTLTSGSGCANRDDCASWFGMGECTANVCVPFEGNMSQGPGEFCDSSDDCDPNTTGSQFLNGLCFSADPTLGDDNVCVIDCTSEADCTPYGMHCAILQSPDGICIAPCTSNAGCGGTLTCDTNTGICQ